MINRKLFEKKRAKEPDSDGPLPYNRKDKPGEEAPTRFAVKMGGKLFRCKAGGAPAKPVKDTTGEY